MIGAVDTTLHEGKGHPGWPTSIVRLVTTARQTRMGEVERRRAENPVNQKAQEGRHALIALLMQLLCHLAGESSSLQPITAPLECWSQQAGVHPYLREPWASTRLCPAKTLIRDMGRDVKSC